MSGQKSSQAAFKALTSKTENSSVVKSCKIALNRIRHKAEIRIYCVPGHETEILHRSI